jgi:hypothetical protein
LKAASKVYCERATSGYNAIAMYRLLFCILMLCGISSGQAGSATPKTFRVEGTIEGPINSAIPHAEVRFIGDRAQRAMVVDDNGRYETDLPLGTYTMSATFPPVGPNHLSAFTKYVRFFSVQSPATITLDGTLFGIYSCDGVWNSDEAYADNCGGKDSFPFPSKDGVPLRLDIDYVRREREEQLVSYSIGPVIKRPILVSYNLFALQADSVDYNRSDGTLRAYGHVVIEDQSGKVNANSASFKFDNGKAIRVW